MKRFSENARRHEGARGFLDAIPALRNRECIVCGEGFAIPIRVRFNDLDPEKRSASSDPSFAELWRETGGEEGIIHRTIKCWRGTDGKRVPQSPSAEQCMNKAVGPATASH